MQKILFFSIFMVLACGFLFAAANNVSANNQCVPLTCNSYNNIALNKPATATAGNTIGFEPGKAVDGNPLTSWNTNPYVADASSASLTINLQQEYPVNSYSITCDGAFGGNAGTIYFYNSANQTVQTKSYSNCKYGSVVTGNFSGNINVSKVTISAISAADNVNVAEFALYGNQTVCGNHSDGCGGQLNCGACPTILCTTDAQCGSNGYINSPICQGGNVYQDYKTWTCNNPGTAQSSCSSNIASQLKTTCASGQTCSNGSCITQNIVCSSNTDCGISGYTGSQYCQGNSIYRNYITYTCNNAGTTNSYCSNNTNNQLYQTCTGNQTCQNGSCSGQNCVYHSYQQCSGNYLYWYDSCGNQQDSTYCPNGCSGNACRGSSGGCQNCSLTLNKTVKNLTLGNSSFSSSTYANPGDILLFMITLVAGGNQSVQNVFVRDYFPGNLIYQNQLFISGSSYNSSGNIISGINLGTINAGQTTTITYQAQVASAQSFSYGATTLSNSVSVTSSSQTSTPSATASVVVTRSAVLAASIISTGLTNNFWVDSFILPLALSLLGIWMLKSGMFFGVERWISQKRKIRRNFKAEKELMKKIAAIKNKETI